MLKDTVFIEKVAATAITGKDAWNRPTPQPITISVSLNTDFHQASVTDNLKYSLNYAVISRNISEFMKANEHKNFKSLANIGESISEVVLDEKKGGGRSVEIVVKSTKSEIRADNIEYRLSRSTTGDFDGVQDEIKVNGLRLLTIVGVFTFERLQKQIVDIDLKIKLLPNANTSIHLIIDEVVQYVESSNFKTVEALVMKIGQLIFQNNGEGISSVSARVTKPNAISYTDGVGVSSDMTPESFKDMEPIGAVETTSHTSFNLPTSETDASVSKGDHIAYIAFGSNVGNPVENITNAIELLKEKVTVLATSSLYISKPMYVKDQPDFYNGAVKIAFTDKTPHQLLKLLKDIEYNHIKRVKEYENGPRSIDLDIILYDDISMNTEDLIIPHKLMLERSFVLQPLCELLPPDLIHPVSAEPIHNHLRQFLNSKPNDSIQESSELLQLIPVPRIHDSINPLKFDQLNNKHNTLIMGILNITPDSFSDGGNSSKLIEEIVESAVSLVNDGAIILDIGGASTRPGATQPSEAEEIDRVLPVIQAIRKSSNEKLASSLISVDTYRANVAEQCLLAGADIINDISMGMYDKNMFDVVAKYSCPYIMNHTRGNPETMSKLIKYESNTNDDFVEYIINPISGHQELVYTPEIDNLLSGVSRELSLQVIKAFEKGVKKWQIIIDPGIGFAKNLQQNLCLIKHASYFKKYSVLVNERDGESVKHNYLSFNGVAMLLGPSRKKFLGTITNEPISTNRVISTAASIVASIEQNTDIVRVHDVKEMRDAVKTGDAIYRDIY